MHIAPVLPVQHVKTSQKFLVSLIWGLQRQFCLEITKSARLSSFTVNVQFLVPTHMTPMGSKLSH